MASTTQQVTAASSKVQPTHHLADVPWIPVITDTGRRKHVGLRAFLTEAHTYRDFDTTAPLTRSALIRFHVPVLAVASRHLPPAHDDVWTEGLPTKAVEQVLSQLDHALWLRHPTRPFMQGWGDDGAFVVKSTAKDGSPIYVDPAPIANLPVGTSGPTSKAWRTSRPVAELPPEQLAIQLVGRWTHDLATSKGRTPSKAGGVTTPAARTGSDLALFWRGPNLLATIAANVPIAWTRGEALPAWADRDGTTRYEDSTDGLEHPLWLGTYNANVINIVWGKAGATGFYAGGLLTAPAGTESTRKGGKKPGEGACDRARELDPFRHFYQGADKKPQLFTDFAPDDARLLSLDAWYSHGGADYIHTRRTSALLNPPHRGWTVEMFRSTTTPMPGASYDQVAWFSTDPKLLTLDARQRSNLGRIAGRAEKVAGALRSALPREPSALSGKSKKRSTEHGLALLGQFGVSERARADFFTAMEDRALNEVLTGEDNGKIRDALTEDMVTEARAIYDRYTQPYMGGPLTPQIIRYRNLLDRQLEAIIAPSGEAHE